MALINCPECSNAVSDRSPSCIKCGFPFKSENEHADSDTPNSKHDLLGTQTIQATNKDSKILQAAGAAATVIGFFFTIAVSPELGIFIVLFGLLTFLAGRISAWWRNG